MRIIDISMEIHPEMATYKGKGMPPKRETYRRFEEGGVNETGLTINLHTGTHLDSPLHMVDGGTDTTALPLERLVTKARVLDCTDAEDAIRREHLERHTIEQGAFVLLKTRNSFDPKCGGEHFVYVARDAAQYLADLGVIGVGIDTLGIERDQPDRMTHVTLLSRDIIILEGLRLGHVEAGDYLLIALPVYIRGAEGAPTRAVLVDGEVPTA